MLTISLVWFSFFFWSWLCFFQLEPHRPSYIIPTFLSHLPPHHLYAYHPTRHLPPYMLTYLPTSPHIVLPTYIYTTSLLFDEWFVMWILHPYLKIWTLWVFYLSYFSYFYYPPMFFLTYLPKTYVTLTSTNENNAKCKYYNQLVGIKLNIFKPSIEYCICELFLLSKVSSLFPKVYDNDCSLSNTKFTHLEGENCV